MRDAEQSTRVRGILAISVKIVLTLVIFYFLFREVSRHWEDVKTYDWQVDWGCLVLSVLVGLITFVIMSSNWRRIIAGFGHRVSLLKSFRIFYLSDMGRYIPGKIWPLLGILYLTRKEGIPPEEATASFVLVQLFAIPASFLVFVLAVQVEPLLLVDQVAILGDKSAYIASGAMLLLSTAIVLWPQKLLAFGNVVLRRLSRPEITFALDKRVALRIFLGYSLGWFCYGIAFFLFLRAVTGQVGIGLIAAAGIFNAAYQIGYMTLIAPGGFGPREYIMGLMLVPFLGPVALTVAIVARLWAVVVEITAALIALAIRR